MEPDTPGPFLPSVEKLDLKDQFSTVIDDGIACLEKALAIDPGYDHAMAYMSLLIRERGDLLDLPDEWERATATADEWIRKTLEARRKKAASAELPEPTERAAPPEPPEPPGFAEPVEPPEPAEQPEPAGFPEPETL